MCKICDAHVYKYEDEFVILQSIGIIVVKKVQSPMPEDILVDNLIPNSVYYLLAEL